MTNSRRLLPPVALTMGDASGIGPEITCAAWNVLRDEVPMVFVGDRSVLSTHGIPTCDFGNAKGVGFPVIDVPLAETVTPGKVQLPNADATINAIETAVDLAQKGDVSAIVTNPITKKILVEGADFKHPGHTEFLARLDGKKRSVMMLACAELKVVPTTIHIPINDVPAALTPQLLQETIQITHDALRRDFGINSPRIAVAGLNPHAGEGGLMGHEEQEMMEPVLNALCDDGISLVGPLPADTMFHAAARQRYDVAVCMYHDQALIPVKTLGFDTGVNVTLGLSFIRTSPDHGTAYDIAGKGIANPSSLIEAIRLAHDMAKKRL